MADKSKAKPKAGTAKESAVKPCHPLKVNGKEWDRQKTSDFICSQKTMAANKPEGVVDIYGLACPDTGEVRYIGKANDCAKRLKSHLRDSVRRDTPVYRWIRKLSAHGKIPRLILLCNSWGWAETEREVIAQHRLEGVRLLNVAEGGEEPFCPKSVRSENGRKNAAIRVSTPRKAKLYHLKRMLGIALKEGHVREETKVKLRSLALRNPAEFGVWANV